MHTRNITVLQEEAQRLIALEREILQKMLDQPGLLGDAGGAVRGTFTPEQTRLDLETLHGEHTKLQQLELVIAVVGTMKAGKSTTINAIVGTEVLPNRNRPMTAIPTLIRHTPGQTEPVLYFSNSAPVERLVAQLAAEIAHPDNAALVSRIGSDRDMAALLRHIAGGAAVAAEYHGAEQIFSFLRTLNDLVRLSAELGVPFPFADYDEIHEIPVIRVEFAHLRGAEAQGTLTLLDTPGPNEAGQPHLRRMLSEQLAKASAVLAVLDYTQLKSDADAQIQAELKEIAGIAEGRMYALVNKFDQADRNSDSADDIRRFVADTLTQGRIGFDSIYPVSSRSAYLANRARTALALHQCLPSADEHPWVADFGDEALGRRWEKYIGDMEQVREAADELWVASRFAAPVSNVILFAQGRAAILALGSAAAKLMDMANRLANFFNTRETALSKSSQELQQQIEALRRDIDRVAESEGLARSEAKNTLRDLEKHSDAMFRQVKSQVAKAIDIIFDQRKKEEQNLAAAEAREEPQGSPGNLSIFSVFAAFLKRPHSSHERPDSPHLDPENPVMTFPSRGDAEQKLRAVQAELRRIVQTGESAMKDEMSGALERFQKNFSTSVVARARGIIDEMRSRLKDGGFELRLEIPPAAVLSLPSSGGRLLGDLISEKTERRSRRRRQSGAWGKVCSVFGTDDWGWEDYTESVDVYQIDSRAIRKSVDEDINLVFDGLDEALAEKIRQPLEKGIDEFFRQFRDTVEHIRGDLLQGLQDVGRTRDEQEELLRHLADLKRNVPAIQQDSSGLKRDVGDSLDMPGVSA